VGLTPTMSALRFPPTSYMLRLEEAATLGQLLLGGLASFAVLALQLLAEPSRAQ